MSQRFIVAGPIDGLYHVLYKVPNKDVYGAPCSSHQCEDDALKDAELLEEQQAAHERSLSEKF